MANYTQHYHLHQWEPEDSFLRTDFNGDLSAIDAALLGLERDKCRAAIGRYTGDGELSYTVSLGARPKLAVVDNTSSFSSGYELGLGVDAPEAVLTEDVLSKLYGIPVARCEMETAFGRKTICMPVPGGTEGA